MSRFRLVHGDCREVARRLPADWFHALVTDAPYHLTQRRGGSRGIMGHRWDGGGVAFEPETWAEFLRIMRPGAWLACAAAPRTAHRLTCAIEDAGFEVRDEVALFTGGVRLEWLQAQGMQKSKRADRMVSMKLCGLEGRHFEATLPPADRRMPGDHVCPDASGADPWRGWGTGLRQHHEPVVLARKPLAPGLSLGENLLRWGTGALWVDGARNTTSREPTPEELADGRWPPNVVLVHASGCWLKGMREVAANPTWDTPNRDTRPSSFTGATPSPRRVAHGPTSGRRRGREGEATAGKRYDGRGGTAFAAKPGRRTPAVELVEEWVCEPGCPVRMLEERAPGASRYHSRFAWSPDDVLPILCAPKADRTPFSAGGEDDGYVFPTPKPLSVYRHLVRLVAGPGGRDVFEPFCGSGTTPMAALAEGHRCYAAELYDTAEHPHVRVARARVQAAFGEPG